MAALSLGAVLALSGCEALPWTGGPTGEPAPSEQTEQTEQTQSTQAAPEDPALEGACTAFWGDPEYTAPLSRDVLDRAGTVPQAGPSDPFFYAMTGDDVDAAFEGAGEDARAAATQLSDWFRTQPERGEDADGDAFVSAWEGVAGACADVSPAASWALEQGEPGTKPSALVCADIFDTPGTLTHFGNANVLTSNMFKLVGLSGQQVPQDRMDDVQATADLLAEEIDAADDEAVRAALKEIRAPFQEALDGDTSSPGLRDPLADLGAACTDVGYQAPDMAEHEQQEQGEGDDGGLV